VSGKPRGGRGVEAAYTAGSIAPFGVVSSPRRTARDKLQLYRPAPALAVGGHTAVEGADIEALRELVSDLPHVTVESRGGRLTLGGWTADRTSESCSTRSWPRVRKLLDLYPRTNQGDPHRLIEWTPPSSKTSGWIRERGPQFSRSGLRSTPDCGMAHLAAFNWDVHGGHQLPKSTSRNVSERGGAFLAGLT